MSQCKFGTLHCRLQSLTPVLFIKFAFNREPFCVLHWQWFYFALCIANVTNTKITEFWMQLCGRLWWGGNGYSECTVHIAEHRAREKRFVLVCLFSAPSISTEGTWLPWCLQTEKTVHFCRPTEMHTVIPCCTICKAHLSSMEKYATSNIFLQNSKNIPTILQIHCSFQQIHIPFQANNADYRPGYDIS